MKMEIEQMSKPKPLVRWEGIEILNREQTQIGMNMDGHCTTYVYFHRLFIISGMD
jgi:hypothetical protein